MLSSQPLARHDRLVWAAVLPLLLYLTLTGAGASFGVFVTPFRVVSLVILAVVFTSWSISAWTHPGARPRTTLWLPMILVLLAMGASTVASSDPRAGAEFVGYAVILAALYLLVVILMGRPAMAQRVVIVLAGATLALAVAYVAAVGAAWVEWWGLVGRLAVPPTRPAYQGLTYEAPGILTAFLVSAAAASVALLISGGRRERIAVAILAGFVAVAVVLASARGGWLGVGAAIVITGAAALATGGHLSLPSSGRARAAIAGVAALAILGLVAISPAIVDRLVGGGGEQLRLTFAAVSLRIFEAHPILGSGPGTWGALRAANTHAGEIDYYIPHAHNVLLQTLAETGVVGVLVGIVLAVAVLRLVVPAIRSRDAERRAIGLGALFVGTYLLVHQMVDFFMDDPAILFAAAVPIAALDAIALREAHLGQAGLTQQLRGLVRSRAAVPIAATLVVVILLFRVEWPALIATGAAGSFSDGQPDAALTQIDDALSLDPGQTSYLWIQGLAADAAGDPALARADFRSVAEHDGLPQAWLNLAALEVDAGATSAAEQDLGLALRLGIQQPAVALPAAFLWVRLGNHDEAVRSAVAALSVAPSLTDDPWWSSFIGLEAVRDSAVKIILGGRDSELAWQVAMYAGDSVTATSIATRLPPVERQLAAMVIDAWAGNTDAVAALDTEAGKHPDQGAAVWAARVAARDGDQAAAARYRRWALLSSNAAGVDTGYDTVVTEHIDNGRQVPGPDANFHFYFVDRRTVPWTMLINELPKLTLR